MTDLEFLGALMAIGGFVALAYGYFLAEDEIKKLKKEKAEWIQTALKDNDKAYEDLRGLRKKNENLQEELNTLEKNYQFLKGDFNKQQKILSGIKSCQNIEEENKKLKNKNYELEQEQLQMGQMLSVCKKDKDVAEKALLQYLCKEKPKSIQKSKRNPTTNRRPNAKTKVVQKNARHTTQDKLLPKIKKTKKVKLDTK